PVGARNATTGLIAGATNSTLSQIQGSTSSVSTVAVWYQGGGAPVLSPEIQLWPETVGREGYIMRGPIHDGMLEDRIRAEQFREEHPFEARAREEHVREMHPREERSPEERGDRASQERRGGWACTKGPGNSSPPKKG